MPKGTIPTLLIFLPLIPMQKFALSDFTAGIEAVMRDPKVRVATVFQLPLAAKPQRVRVTRKGKDGLVVTFGRPNFRERAFLADCKKAKCQPRKLWLQLMKPKAK